MDSDVGGQREEGRKEKREKRKNRCKRLRRRQNKWEEKNELPRGNNTYWVDSSWQGGGELAHLPLASLQEVAMGLKMAAWFARGTRIKWFVGKVKWCIMYKETNHTWLGQVEEREGERGRGREETVESDCWRNLHSAKLETSWMVESKQICVHVRACECVASERGSLF